MFNLDHHHLNLTPSPKRARVNRRKFSNRSMFEALEKRALMAAVSGISPSNFGLSVGVNSSVKVTFGSDMIRSSVNSSTFQLLDSGNSVITGRISYNANNRTATFDASAPLQYGATYHAVVKSGGTGVLDTSGGTLAADASWSFTTAAAPTTGSGGPILVVTASSNPFSGYLAEILRAEGLNSFATADIGSMNATLLNSYQTVILGETPLTAGQVTTLTNWVTAGGNLIAMRPDKLLAPLLGLTTTPNTSANTYVKINTNAGPGVGITGDTMQYHGAADLYTLNGATAVATLFSNATTGTSNPAVTVRSVGSAGGQAAAFTFDLAKSVIYTRQGNPAWSGQERDGSGPARSDDLFFGNSPTDPQPDWVDLNKVQIPQADEQQRLLANMIEQFNLDKMPIPRFWYLPNGNKAMMIMTGDDHNYSGDNTGTSGRWNVHLNQGTSGGVPIRGTSYIIPEGTLSDALAAQFAAQGFELGLHVEVLTPGTDNPRNWTSYSDLNALYLAQLSQFENLYPSIGAPKTNRTHAIVWSDYDSQPQVEFSFNIRFDTNYYYWPGSWVQDRPGMFTGSGMPMRFARADGTMVDVYQAATQLTDENNATYAYHVNTLLNNALGSLGYYGAFTVNAHTDFVNSALSDAVIASAKARGVPVVTAQAMMDWLDGRNGSTFSAMTWNNTLRTLNFSVNLAEHSSGLQAMVPVHGNGNLRLTGITAAGSPVTYTIQTIKGIEYAFYNAAAGANVATYAPDTVLPTITTRTPASGAVGVPATAKPSVTFSEEIQPSTISFLVRDAANITVGGTVSYDAVTNTAIFTPTSTLNPGTTYTAQVSGAVDTAGNTMSGTSSWSFTILANTSQSIWSPSATPAIANSPDGAIEVGVKFRADVAGQITGIRFYKGSNNTGVHIGSLWDSTGNLLAQATFNSESASGWQEVSFSSPVTVSANTTYVASYHTNVGNYSVDLGYFANSGTDNVYLHALSNGVEGGNGVFKYGPNPVFPTDSFNANNFWVDVNFLPTAGDATAPTIDSQNPAPAATNVATNTAISAIFSEGVQSATIAMTVRDAANNNVAGTFSYNPTTLVITFTPTSVLSQNTTYTATISGAKDGAGNTMASTSWSFATVVGDIVPPTVTAQSPAPGATGIAQNTTITATFSEAIQSATISMVLRDAANNVVAGTVSYNSTTRVATFTPSASLAPSTTYTMTVSATKDTAGNTMSPFAFSFSTLQIVGATLWPSSTVPSTTQVTSTTGTEVGVKFIPAYNGTITGVRFYKGTNNTGTHVGKLWSSTGTLLATINFTGETASGWQQMNFTTPVSVTAGTTYIVSYYAPNGRYARVTNYFTSTYTNGPLSAPSNTAAGGNGVLRTGAGFPNTSGAGANYYVDAVFSSLPLADTVAPTVTARTPASGATGVATSTTVTATFSEAVQSATISMVLRDAANTVIPGTVSYNASTFVATFTPTSVLSGTTVYTMTVSGTKDTAGNTMTSTNWSFTTATVDVTPPTITARTPASGATNVAVASTITATFSEAVQSGTISMVLRDAANTVIAGTVSYNAGTFTATFTPTVALSTSTVYTMTVSGTKDVTGNTMVSTNWSFTTAAPAPTTTSIWSPSAVPTTPSANDTSPLEVGVKFRSSAAGFINSIRFYKGSANTGTHTAHLWSSTGTLLGTATFISETATGWQEVSFASPIAISANTTYIASYYAPQGGYAADANYFASAGVTNGPITALANGVDGGNGVFFYGAGGGFPNLTWNSTNYWVDVVYSATGPADTTAPTITAQSPSANATNVAVGSAITATFSEAVQSGTISMILRNAANTVIAGTVTYNSGTNTATFTPTAALALNTVYTMTVSGTKDIAGNTMSSTAWSFTTVSSTPTTTSIWSPSAVPTTPSANDTSPLEVGVKFRSSAAGFINSIRFYKGSANTGTHTAHLWSSTGTLLGTATFINESATGWQEVSFASPIAISANTTYIASYYAPQGGYAADANYFASAGVTNGPITALANGVDGGNGVFFYGAGGGFPNLTWNSTNYWVDVVYSATGPADTTAPTITARTPASGATGVATASSITATFSESVQSGTISMVLRNAANTVIAGTVTYNSGTNTATFTPTAALALNTVYTMTVSGTKDIAGNTMTSTNWSFTTASSSVQSIWSDTTVPSNPADADSSPLEVGVKFRVNTNGFITGIRFYKGTGNGGTHIGHLWSSTGTLLATITFQNETATGWQTALFSAPVAVTAGTTYIASYYAPQGHYAATGSFFTTGVTNGAITALADGVDGGNGVFFYGAGGGFPNLTWNSTNYWVDVLFSTTA